MLTKTIALLSFVVAASLFSGCGAATKTVVDDSLTGPDGPIEFKSGVQMELILSDNVAKKSWKADGLIMKEWVRPHDLLPSPEVQPKWFIVKVENGATQNPPAIAFRFGYGEIVRSAYSSLEYHNLKPSDIGKASRLYGTENTISGKSTTHLDIGLADGPWQTVGAYKNDNGKFVLDQGSAFNLFVMSEGDKNDAVRTPAPPLPEGVQLSESWLSATVELPKTIAKHDYRLIALDRGGKPLQSAGYITAKDETIPYQYWFVGRVSDIDRVELQIRHYAWTEFKYVKLSPK